MARYTRRARRPSMNWRWIMTPSRSDVFISWLIVSFVVLAKLSVFDVPPLVLDMLAIMLTIVFVFTGRTFRAIAEEQKRLTK